MESFIVFVSLSHHFSSRGAMHGGYLTLFCIIPFAPNSALSLLTGTLAKNA